MRQEVRDRQTDRQKQRQRQNERQSGTGETKRFYTNHSTNNVFGSGLLFQGKATRVGNENKVSSCLIDVLKDRKEKKEKKKEKKKKKKALAAGVCYPKTVKRNANVRTQRNMFRLFLFQFALGS